MFANFKNNTPTNTIWLIILTVLLKLPAFSVASLPVATENDGLLYQYLSQALAQRNMSTGVAYGLLVIVLYCVVTLQLVQYVNNNKLFKTSNYVSGFSFSLISSLLIYYFYFTPILILLPAVMWLLVLCTTIIKRTQNNRFIYFTSLLVGCMVYIYKPAIIFLLLPFTALLFLRNVKLKEWVLVLVGFVTPTYVLLCLLYISNQLDIFKITPIEFTVPLLDDSLVNILAVVSVTLIAIIGIYFVFTNVAKQVVQTRKLWQLIIAFLLLCILSMFLGSSQNFSKTLFIILPLSIFVAAAFIYIKNQKIVLLIQLGLLAMYVYQILSSIKITN